MIESELIGDFNDISKVSGGEFLQLCLQPSSLSFEERWRNNGISADFLSDYIGTFFKPSENDHQSVTRHLEIKDSVAYIANELIENGMKYTDSSAQQPLRIKMLINNDEILFNGTNSVTSEQADIFKEFIARLNNSDPFEMFIEQIEAQQQNGSGLGCLTMINDHQAELSWRFINHEKEDIVTITTAVKLPI